MTFQQWLSGAIGRGMDPDGVWGYQCVDVPKDYAMAIFPSVNWVDSIGYGNAKDLYGGSNSKYFDKIANNPNDANLIPQAGDIIVYNSWWANPYGHIAVVISANQTSHTVVEQDGTYPSNPAYKTSRSYTALPIIGWLRPRQSVTLAPYQRQVAASTINYRESASTSANVLNTFANGDVIDLKGFVHGENVDGNDIWFVGKYSGGYLWSGGFSDTSNNSLSDLTPPPPSQAPNQRTVGAASVNYRKYPMTSAAVIKSFVEGDTLDFDAFARGESVQGNNIWFRGKYTGGWAWSGAFTDAGTHDLAEVSAPALPDNPGQTPIDPVYSVRPLVNNTLWGIDVSSFQGLIDWASVKSMVDFAIVRGGHVGPDYGGGDNRTDTEFVKNQAAARAAGLPVAYYWYVFLSDDPIIEAQRFVNSVGTIAEGESLWLDLEETSPAEVDKATWAAAFVVKVEELTGQPCHLYTYWSYAKDNAALATVVTGGRKLWLAHYDMAPGSDLSGQPLGSPVMHQYTSKGTIAGVNSNVDLNVFYGTVKDFKALGKTQVVVEPTPEPEPEPTPEPEPQPTPKPNIGDQIVAFLKALLEGIRKLFSKKG